VHTVAEDMGLAHVSHGVEPSRRIKICKPEEGKLVLDSPKEKDTVDDACLTGERDLSEKHPRLQDLGAEAMTDIRVLAEEARLAQEELVEATAALSNASAAFSRATKRAAAAAERMAAQMAVVDVAVVLTQRAAEEEEVQKAATHRTEVEKPQPALRDAKALVKEPGEHLAGRDSTMEETECVALRKEVAILRAALEQALASDKSTLGTEVNHTGVEAVDADKSPALCLSASCPGLPAVQAPREAAARAQALARAALAHADQKVRAGVQSTEKEVAAQAGASSAQQQRVEVREEQPMDAKLPEQIKTQLNQLHVMGFANDKANIAALGRASGRIEKAVELLLEAASVEA
jgi:hypothetical protein